MSRAPALIVEMPFDDGFENERHQRKECEQRRDREGGDEIIFIVEDLDMQRHRVGLSRSSTMNIISRSEEHTSELQSLMRISYAVFCLKKKKVKHRTYETHINIMN